MDIVAIFHTIVHWIKDQNWFVLSFAIVGWLNCIAAGTRVMGWTSISDFCGKLEDAIKAMVEAAMVRRNGGQAIAGYKPPEKDDKVMKTLVLLLVCASLGGCVGYRLSHIHGTMSSNAIMTPYGPLNGNVAYDAVTCLGNCPKANFEVMYNAEVNDAGNTNAVLING